MQETFVAWGETRLGYVSHRFIGSGASVASVARAQDKMTTFKENKFKNDK